MVEKHIIGPGERKAPRYKVKVYHHVEGFKTKILDAGNEGELQAWDYQLLRKTTKISSGKIRTKVIYLKASQEVPHNIYSGHNHEGNTIIEILSESTNQE